jgi:hypothetical protein
MKILSSALQHRLGDEAKPLVSRRSAGGFAVVPSENAAAHRSGGKAPSVQQTGGFAVWPMEFE